MSTLAIVAPAVVAAGTTLRFVIRHDRAVTRFILTMVAVIGNGPRARRAARLLDKYLDSSK